MIGSFNFNGVESDTFKLVCKSIKRPLLPAVKIKRIDLPGSSGVYDFEDNEYSLRTITMRVVYLGTSFLELRSRARSISAWLSTPTWARLILHDEPSRYYLAKVTSEIDLSSLQEAGEAQITFDCQPFAYGVNEVIKTFNTTIPTTFNFYNPGTRMINYRSPYGSKFNITITGVWSMLSLSMNGETLNYTNAEFNKTLILNNIEMEATIDNNNRFFMLTGSIDSFLKIIPGNNILDIGGAGLNVLVTINFIPMWI